MPSDMVVTLYYDIDAKTFMDEDGFFVTSIYDYITPNMFNLFLMLKEYMLIEVTLNNFVELMYPEDDEEEE